MNAIEKIISQMNEAAEQERAALEQEERMKIDQNFEQKRTQVETEHQKQKENKSNYSKKIPSAKESPASRSTTRKFECEAGIFKTIVCRCGN